LPPLLGCKQTLLGNLTCRLVPSLLLLEAAE
jgi:hypothetical protein